MNDAPEDASLDSLEAWLSESMDAPPELLTVLPALLQDTDELGVRASDVLVALSPAELSQASRALDLGCGKGAVALAIAERYGARVLGVDGHAGFIAAARDQAERRGLSARVTFEQADLRDHVPGRRDYDLLSLLALGDVLGDGDETLAQLSTCLCPRGLLLIDDAYLSDAGCDDVDLLEAYEPRAALIARFEACGFALVHEHPIDGPDSAAHYEVVTARIAQRAAQLQGAHPHLADALEQFARRQREQLSHLDGPVQGGLFLLRRTT